MKFKVKIKDTLLWIVIVYFLGSSVLSLFFPDLAEGIKTGFVGAIMTFIMALLVLFTIAVSKEKDKEIRD